jgi:hypothetical protein
MSEITPNQNRPGNAGGNLGVLMHAHVRRRTRELAASAGRTSSEISQADYEQAKAEAPGQPHSPPPTQPRDPSTKTTTATMC